MEKEILQTLQEIRGILYIFITVIIFVVLLWLIQKSFEFNANLKKTRDNIFIYRADKYFECADLDQLIKRCHKKLKMFPNNSHALWWLAKTHLKKGGHAEA